MIRSNLLAIIVGCVTANAELVPPCAAPESVPLMVPLMSAPPWVPVELPPELPSDSALVVSTPEALTERVLNEIAVTLPETVPLGV
jgi:hypothetical protein